MPGHVASNDREKLQAAIKHWQAELEKDRRRLGRLTKLEERARREIQTDKAKRDRAKLDLKHLPAEETPRHKALDLALSFVGTVEHPAGSNGGGPINGWQDRFHMGRGPWCGAFVGAMAELGGGADLSDRIVYTPYILEDARAGRNGLRRVLWSEEHGWETSQHYAPVFSLVLFDFHPGAVTTIQHVGALRERWTGGSTLATVEGNTSFGPGGSQDNGGAVARRERDRGLVRAVVAMEWPGKF